MRRFVLEQSATETYASHSGLALIGECLRRSRIADLVKTVPLRHGISHGDLLKSYAGLLSLGKSDFAAVENVREDTFFREALGIGRVPSAARLRQRFDTDAKALLPFVDEAMVVLLESVHAPVTALGTGHAALDIDAFPMDNSGTKKEGVSRTYHGFDGYAPIAVYLGEEGWCLACEARAPAESQGQREFGYGLDRVLPRARRLTSRPLLRRMDSGHDAWENRARCHEEDVDFVMEVESTAGGPSGVARLRKSSRALGSLEQPTAR